MNRHDEEEAWRQIVANYGERARLDDTAGGSRECGSSPDPGEGDQADRPTGRSGDDPSPAPGAAHAGRDRGDDDTSAHPKEDPALPGDFVPPEPPPLPRPRGPRGLAWVGLLGSPLLLVICLVVGVDLPRLAAYALAATFVGGFCYLVATMPRGPGDPGDDGARL